MLIIVSIKMVHQKYVITWIISIIFIFYQINVVKCLWKREEDKTKCPKVKEMKNFDISGFMGSWYIVQYYASSEEALAYKCMRADFSLSPDKTEVTMNFTYSFIDDPINEIIIGNITWKIPYHHESLAHWIHAEFPYEEVYNTYVLDSDYKSWALLLHCAEKNKSPRYLSSFIMSRKKNLGVNVVSYLRDKLPRYNINVEYVFPMEQKNCKIFDGDALMIPPVVAAKRAYLKRHPL
ncbi:apolipoprotein D [Chelonus insularis]|uniref:apolipoprotein D n=1 Tax=Chelonus insularis TaxID=460826 RepID=UPI00158CCF49|nr:apolipoprotein D [Chelonus insularis]